MIRSNELLYSAFLYYFNCIIICIILSMNMLFLSSNLRINHVYILICVLYELSMIVNLTLQNTLFLRHFTIVYFDFM